MRMVLRDCCKSCTSSDSAQRTRSEHHILAYPPVKKADGLEAPLMKVEGHMTQNEVLPGMPLGEGSPIQKDNHSEEAWYPEVSQVQASWGEGA